MYPFSNVFKKVCHPLVLAISFSTLLLAARVVWLREFDLLFLLWNLFLAAIPVVFAYLLVRYNRPPFSLLSLSLFLSCLLFLPNAPYLITDFIHYRVLQISVWLDLMILFSFSISGLACCFYALWYLKIYLRQFMRPVLLEGTIFLLLFLGSLGVYIGRFERFNSWDIFIQPVALFADVFYIITNPIEKRAVWYFISAFWGMLSFIYVLLKSFRGQALLVTRQMQQKRAVRKDEKGTSFFYKPKRVLSKSFFQYDF